MCNRNEHEECFWNLEQTPIGSSKSAGDGEERMLSNKLSLQTINSPQNIQYSQKHPFIFDHNSEFILTGNINFTELG